MDSCMGTVPILISMPHGPLLAACDWRARLVFLAKDLMELGFRVSDVPH